MNVTGLDEFLNSERYQLPASRLSAFSQYWYPKEVGTYVIRILPADPVKCPNGIGFSIVHWGIAKSSIRCAKMDTDYAQRLLQTGTEPCLCCRLFEWFVKNEGNDEKMQVIRNDMRPQKLLLYPAYLPKVLRFAGKVPVLDEADKDPTTVIWQVGARTLQKTLLTVCGGNEYLTDPVKGKFILLDVTKGKGADRYPALSFYPLIGGSPIHPDSGVMASILGDLYPDVSKAEQSGRRADVEVQKLIEDNAELAPYLH